MVVVVVRTWCNDDVSVDTVTRACTEFGRQNTWEQAPGVPATPEPSMTKNSSSSRAHLALNVRMDGARKNGLKKAKTPLIAAITAIEEVINRDGDNLVDELHVRNLGSFLHCHDKHLLLHTNGHVNNLVHEQADRNVFLNELQLWEPTVFSTTGTGETCTTCTTRTLTTLSTHCNRGIAMVF